MRIQVKAVFLVLLMLMGCNLMENEQSVPPELIGKWKWVLTTEGAWSQPISADTAGYKMSLMIYSQNKASWFRNDTLIDNYSIKEGNSKWTQGKLVMRRMHSEDIYGCGFILEYDPDTQELLLPSADCTDLPVFHFRKVRN